MISFFVAIIFHRIRYLYCRPKLRDALVDASVPVTLFANYYSIDPKPKPAACVICPTTIEEIQNAVRCARKAMTKISVRSGGLYSSYGSCEGLVIDLCQFSDIDFDTRTKMVTVGAGVRLGTLDMNLYHRGKRAFPHGGFPSKIITGYALLGGFGYLSRMKGLTVDSIVSMRVVLADASVVTASSTENKELFWALCGAGASFGIVVELKLRTFPAPEGVIVYRYVYRYRKNVPFRMTQALMAVRRFAASEPAAELGIGVEVCSGGKFVLRGAYFGGLEPFYNEIRPLLVALDAIGHLREIKLNNINWQQYLYSLPEGRRVPLAMREGEHDEYNTLLRTLPLYESAFKLVTIVNIYSLFHYLFMTAPNFNVRWCVVIDLHGGINSNVLANRPLPTDPTSKSCYGHRNCWFKYQFCAAHTPSDNPKFIDQFVKTMAASFSRDYEGGSRFKADLEDKHYYGDATKKLKDLKYKYDPEGLFPTGFKGK